MCNLRFAIRGVAIYLVAMLTEATIRTALETVKYPGYSRNIISFGLLRGVTIDQGAIRLLLQVSSDKAGVVEKITTDCEKALAGLPEVRSVEVEVQSPPAAAPAGATQQTAWAYQNRLAGIERVVAVASGKGGVGKSTVSVNLACALSQLGARVGLLDCDIYGPSIPLMMGIHQRPTVSANEKLEPPLQYGVKLMSIGFLLDGDAPVIWRGPMVVKAIQQFVNWVEWGELDFLLVDLPPGTGDAQLSLCQTVPLDGGVVVTTPQEASLGVVRKGIAMFEKVNVPILGLIENMSYFVTPGGERVEIFGHGGGRAEAERQRLTFLGEIPLFTEIRLGGDTGVPVVVSMPDAPPGQAFRQVALAVRQKFNSHG